MEKMIVSGPTTSNFLLYACFFGGPNRCITCKYAVQSYNQNSGYFPGYRWQFVDWKLQPAMWWWQTAV
jgi:hypothetical protein